MNYRTFDKGLSKVVNDFDNDTIYYKWDVEGSHGSQERLKPYRMEKAEKKKRITDYINANLHLVTPLELKKTLIKYIMRELV